MSALRDSRFLELWRIGKQFPGPADAPPVIADFSLQVARGEFVALLGHSGCGKSTVLSMLAGLTAPSTGGIILNNREIDGPGVDRGMVFQSPSLLPWLTAQENVALWISQAQPELPRARVKALAAEQLAQVGLEDARNRRPGELSQGMQQRVGLARAFAMRPQVLLLDEPFGMLDSLTRADLQDVLIDLQRTQQITTVMVTHDVDEALLLADRIVLMTNGPRAHVGEIFEVPFPRPRDRHALREHPDYYEHREQLVGFLEDRAHARPWGGETPVPELAGDALPAARAVAELV